MAEGDLQARRRKSGSTCAADETKWKPKMGRRRSEADKRGTGLADKLLNPTITAQCNQVINKGAETRARMAEREKNIS